MTKGYPVIPLCFYLIIFLANNSRQNHITNNIMDMNIILQATGTPNPKLKAKIIPAIPSSGLTDDHSKYSVEGA